MLTEKDINAAFESFAEEFEPLETKSSAVGGGELFVLVDKKTGAHFCECHISASKLIELGTVDVPLDPEDQADYRANREVVEDAYAFERMKEDALARRSFSNIVAEYTKEFDSVHPLKIIGGQHRFEAISAALKADISESEQDDVTATVSLLMEKGPQLPFPHSSGINGSRHSHMRELRIQSGGRPIRVLYAFDPRRTAILLIGGDKKGDGRFYEKMVPAADDLYDTYIAEIRKEGLIP